MKELLAKSQDIFNSCLQKQDQLNQREKGLQEREALVAKRSAEIAERERSVGPREAAVKHIENLIEFRKKADELHNLSQSEAAQLSVAKKEFKTHVEAEESRLKEWRISLTKGQDELIKKKAAIEKEIADRVRDLAGKLSKK
ncbi:MAG: hypothetical protein WCP55_18595 [Lentisphaerota bacterium]